MKIQLQIEQQQRRRVLKEQLEERSRRHNFAQQEQAQQSAINGRSLGFDPDRFKRVNIDPISKDPTLNVISVPRGSSPAVPPRPSLDSSAPPVSLSPGGLGHDDESLMDDILGVGPLQFFRWAYNFLYLIVPRAFHIDE